MAHTYMDALLPGRHVPLNISKFPTVKIWCEKKDDNGAVLARIWTIDNYLPKKVADKYYNTCIADDFPLEADPVVKIFGKTCHSHRRVGFFSNIASSYPFAGTAAYARPYPSWLEELQDTINQDLVTAFSGGLVNHYRSGLDWIGAHADDERTLSQNTVAAISLGTSRIFRVTLKTPTYTIVNGEKVPSKKVRVVDIPTSHAQLLVMDGDAQKYWKHEIPPSKRINDARVSITFRAHVPHED